MSLLQGLDHDLRTAMKGSDKLRVSVLRLVKAAVKNKQIEKGLELSDDEIMTVISTLAKQRRESIEQFSRGGREELADQERQELLVLQSYMPEQLSHEKVDDIIRQAISEASATSDSDIGKVMRILAPRIKGLADGRLVNTRVKELLSSPGT